MATKLKALDDYILEEFRCAGNKQSINSHDKKDDIDPLDKQILRPYKYLVSIPGKKIRQNFIEVLNHWLDIPKDKVEIISEIIYNLHNFSLLVDDIQDNSDLRRSIPTAHTIFGVPSTLIAANFVTFSNLEKGSSLNHPEAVKIYLDFLRQGAAGQGMEIYFRDEFICPTEEEYLEIISRKTGGMFDLAKNLMELFSTRNKDINKFLTSIGLYFQINDDYQNLKSQLYFDSKGFCEDLTEGKFGFPLVHAVNTNPEKGEQIMEILRERTTDVQRKKECIALIEACGSFEYTRNTIKELKRIIFEEIDKLGENPFMDTFFEKMIAEGL